MKLLIAILFCVKLGAYPSYDFFQRPNGGLQDLQSTNWTVVKGVAGILDSAGNGYSGAPTAVLWNETSGLTNDQFAQVRVTGHTGPAVRMAAGVGWYDLIGGNGGSTLLRKCTSAASCTTLGSGGTQAQNGDLLVIKAVGTDITGYVYAGWTSTLRNTLTASDATYSTGGPGWVSSGYGQTVTAWVGGNSSSLPVPVPTVRTDYFASPSATILGDGSVSAPYLMDALLANQGSWLQTGSTVWLRGGTYTLDDQLVSGKNWIITVSGASASSRIRFKAYPGESPSLTVACNDKSAIEILGSYLDIWGIAAQSVGCPDIDYPGSHPYMAPGASFAGVGIGNRLIHNYSKFSGNCVFVAGDTGNTDWYIYGNHCSLSGWDGSDRGHGHAFYTRNFGTGAGTLIHRANIAHSFYSQMAHSYGDLSYGLVYDKNVILKGENFINGAVSPTYSNNVFGSIFPVPGTTSTTVTNNMFASGYTILENSADVNFNNNYAARRTQVADQYNSYTLASFPSSITTQDNNFFWRTNGSDDLIFFKPGTQYSLATWQTATGKDAASTYTASGPTTNWSKVMAADEFEPGRCHVATVNWAAATSMAVSLATCGLRDGDPYQIEDAQQLSAGVILSGTYSAASPNVTFPLDRTGFDTIAGQGTFCWNTDLAACNAARGWTSGAGDPSGSCAAGAYYRRTSNDFIFYCDGVDNWQPTGAAASIHPAQVFSRDTLVQPFIVRRLQSWTVPVTSVKAASAPTIEYGLQRSDGTIGWGLVGPTATAACGSGECTASLLKPAGTLFYRYNGGIPLKAN